MISLILGMIFVNKSNSQLTFGSLPNTVVLSASQTISDSKFS